MTTNPEKKRFQLYVPDPTQAEAVIAFEGYEWPDLEQASRSMIGEYGYKVPIEIFGRAFVMSTDDARRLSQCGLPFTMGTASSKHYATLPCNENEPTDHVKWLDDESIEASEPDTDEKPESRTPFTDAFFAVHRRTMSFVLGSHHEALLSNLESLDLGTPDCCRLLDAAGIDNHHGHWMIAQFKEPLPICGQLIPKGTIIVLQGKSPGCRFTLFSVENGQ